jgi:hypothetical protein
MIDYLPHFLVYYIHMVGQVCAVGIGAGYGLDGPGIRIPFVAIFSALISSDPRAYPASYKMSKAPLSLG